MATSPLHMDDTAQATAQKAAKPPVTASPAFPWIVALWFAALLGVGSLVVPVALMERASEATGLAALLPMAAPPLGFTAQALVALVGTVVGGALGLFLAKRIAAPKPAKAASASSRKVLNPAEDLGDDGIEGEAHDDLPSAPVKGRRRALAIEEEEGPSEFLNLAPLPSAHDHAEEPLEMSADMEEPVLPEPGFEAEDAHQFDEPRQEFQPAEEARQVFQPDPVDPEEAPFDLDESAALTEEQPEAEQVATQQSVERQEFRAVAMASTPVVDVGYSEPVVASATAKEPLPFSPPSMAREDNGDDGFAAEQADEQTFAPEEVSGPESEDTVSDKQIFDAPDAPAHEFTPDVSADEQQVCEADADETVAGEEPDAEAGEGLVQLVQRLGSTLEKHREWSAEKAAQKVAAAPVVVDEEPVAPASSTEAPASEAKVPDEFDPAAAEDAAQAMAAYFSSSAAAPVASEEEPVAEVEAPAAADSAAPAEEEESPRQRYESFRGTIAAVDFEDEGSEDDEDEDEMADLAASFSLPLGRQAKAEPEPTPRPAFDQPPASVEAPVAEEEAEEPIEDEGEEEDVSKAAEFGSLNPFKRNAEEFVRIEEPEPAEGDAEPAVLFPNQESRQPSARAFDPPAAEASAAPQRAERPRPSNDDNERALREALMNLQRMGK